MYKKILHPIGTIVKIMPSCLDNGRKSSRFVVVNASSSATVKTRELANGNC